MIVIATPAKAGGSNPVRNPTQLDCFVASLLAMAEEID
jgi:hypothetical protein